MKSRDWEFVIHDRRHFDHPWSPISSNFIRIWELTPTRAICLFAVIALVTCSVSISHGKNISDERGKKFHPGDYSRIVSLAPNITEILYFAGVGSRVVGVTRFCNYPAPVLEIQKIGGIYDPDPEKIIALTPGLVIATKDGNPRSVIQFLEGAGIPCFVIDPRSLADVIDTIRDVAILTGAGTHVLKRVDKLGDKLDEIKEKHFMKRVRVLFLLSSLPMIGAGSGTFLDEMIILAGGNNVLKDNEISYPRLSIEDIMSLSPDVIFYFTSMGNEQGGGKIDRLKEIWGPKKTEFYRVDPDIYTRPGPRLFDALSEMEGILRRK